jgi:hypothetical protein
MNTLLHCTQLRCRGEGASYSLGNATAYELPDGDFITVGSARHVFRGVLQPSVTYSRRVCWAVAVSLHMDDRCLDG